MHEGAVCVEIMDIVSRVAEKHELTRVSRIYVAAGSNSCLNEQQLNFYFNVAQEGTCMEGAWITVELDETLTGASQMYVRSIEGD